jgi:hypothetical protein
MLHRSFNTGSALFKSFLYTTYTATREEKARQMRRALRQGSLHRCIRDEALSVGLQGTECNKLVLAAALPLSNVWLAAVVELGGSRDHGIGEELAAAVAVPKRVTLLAANHVLCG